MEDPSAEVPVNMVSTCICLSKKDRAQPAYKEEKLVAPRQGEIGASCLQDNH